MSQGDRRRRASIASAPLMPLALAMTAGIVADRYATPCGTAAWAAGAGLLAAGAVLGRSRAWGVAALLLATAALGGGWHHHRWSDLADDDLARADFGEGRPAWARGVLVEVPTFRAGERPDDAGTTRTVLGLAAIRDGMRWRGASGKLLLRVVGDRTDLRAGDAVHAAGRLEAVAGPSNPGEFDHRDYLRAQGIRLALTAGEPDGVWADPDGPSWPWSRRLGRARAWAHARLVEGLDPKVASLAAALLLGRREGVDPDVNDAFARTGTTHLLAISGLHLQVLAIVLWGLFRLGGMGRRPASLGVIAATVAYAMLVGLAPSVVRSAAMTCMVCVACLSHRCARLANMLALAALVTLALNPSDLFDVGCQLSFLAVAAIGRGAGPASDVLAFYYHRMTFRVQGPDGALDALERTLEPWWRALPRRWGFRLWQGVVVSTVVWLAALPLVALRFHVVSPIGIILNVPLIPLTSLALVAAGLTLACSATWPPLASGPSWACARMLDWTERIVRWGASQSWGHRFVAGPPWAWVAAFYALLGLAAIVGFRGRAMRLALGGWAAFGLVLSTWPIHPEATEAEVLAVGHGLAVVVRGVDGRAILYDCGRLGDPGVGRRIIAPALWARGVHRLDEVWLSHADSDHYDGLPDLLDRIPIGAVRVPPGFEGPANPGASRLLDRVRARGIPVRPIAAGESRAIGKTATLLRVLHPPDGWRLDAPDNARSLVVDVDSGGRHLLLTGDLEGPGLARLLADPPRPPDAILSPHHGGRTANPPQLYRWADRSIVVASQRRASASPRDPLAALERRGQPVYRTWRHGAVRMTWKASGLETRGFLDEPPRPTEALTPAPLPRVATALLAFATGLAACLVLAIVEWGAWSLVVPGRRFKAETIDPPPWVPIEAVAADGVTLRGLWREPQGDLKGLAMVLHGFGESCPAMLGRGEALAALGWAVTLPDNRGQGRSDGDRVSFGGREAGDVRAWIDALAPRVGSGAPVVLWGRSMGAAIALKTAAIDPKVSALVLEAPYPDLTASVAAFLRTSRLPFARAWAALIVQRAGYLAGTPLDKPSSLDVAPAVGIPVAILCGGADRIVTPEGSRALADAFPGPVERVDVAGARHADVFEVGGPDLIVRLAAFLDRAIAR